jgi:hypothetical protein
MGYPVEFIERILPLVLPDAVLDDFEQGRGHREGRIVAKSLVNGPPPASFCPSGWPETGS